VTADVRSSSAWWELSHPQMSCCCCCCHTAHMHDGLALPSRPQTLSCSGWPDRFMTPAQLSAVFEQAACGRKAGRAGAKEGYCAPAAAVQKASKDNTHLAAPPTFLQAPGADLVGWQAGVCGCEGGAGAAAHGSGTEEELQLRAGLVCVRLAGQGNVSPQQPLQQLAPG
jgi:hypothetical protein